MFANQGPLAQKHCLISRDGILRRYYTLYFRLYVRLSSEGYCNETLGNITSANLRKIHRVP